MEEVHKWLDGFGNLKEKLEKYDENVRSLKNIGIENGKKDIFVLNQGGEYLHNLLDEKGIKNTYYVNDGDHSSKIRESFNERIVPFFQDIFYNN